VTAAPEILARHGIRRGRGAAYVTTCPQCSAHRRKKRAACLSVLIDGKGVRFNCHHCGWHGFEFYEGPQAQRPGVRIEPTVDLDDVRERHKRSALRIWSETVPLPGTLGERSLIEHRGIDITGIDLDHALRWHACDRMLVALFTAPATGEPTGGIHRIFLRRDGSKIERRMLGPAGIVRLSARASRRRSQPRSASSTAARSCNRRGRPARKA
jgi:hypothetical protein